MQRLQYWRIGFCMIADQKIVVIKNIQPFFFPAQFFFITVR